MRPPDRSVAPDKQALSLRVRIPTPTPIACYVAAVVTAGVAALASQAPQLPAIVEGADLRLALLVGAVLVGELLPIRLGKGQGEVAPSTTFTFAILLTFGTAAAVFAQALGSLSSDLLSRKRLVFVAFNVSQYVLAVVGAGLAHHLLVGSPASRGLRRAAAFRRAGGRCRLLRDQHGSSRDRRLAQLRRAHQGCDRGRPHPPVGDRERAHRSRAARGGRARPEPRPAAAARAAAAGGAARGSPRADQRTARHA